MPLSTTPETAKEIEGVTVTGIYHKHKKVIIGVVIFAALLTTLYYITKTKAIT